MCFSIYNRGKLAGFQFGLPLSLLSLVGLGEKISAAAPERPGRCDHVPWL